MELYPPKPGTLHSLAAMSKRVCFIVLLCIPTVCLNQPAELNGVILGTLSYKPPIKVQLSRWCPPFVATVAASDGRFSFRNLSAGTYRLRVRHPGKRGTFKNCIAVKRG